jgi:hypothetical protein
MPVSECYVIDYLLRETDDRPASLDWTESESGGFLALFHDVRIQMYSVQSMSGPRLCLEFGLAHDKIYVQEPCKVAFFGCQYRTEADAEVAARLHELYAAIARQVRIRLAAASEHEVQIRESIFRQVLFGTSEEKGISGET